jgi:hypothetical protein
VDRWAALRDAAIIHRRIDVGECNVGLLAAAFGALIHICRFSVNIRALFVRNKEVAFATFASFLVPLDPSIPKRGVCSIAGFSVDLRNVCELFQVRVGKGTLWTSSNFEYSQVRVGKRNFVQDRVGKGTIVNISEV